MESVELQREVRGLIRWKTSYSNSIVWNYAIHVMKYYYNILFDHLKLKESGWIDVGHVLLGRDLRCSLLQKNYFTNITVLK